MSDHHFNPFIAEKYGVFESIFLNSMVFWTRTNAAKEKNFHENRYWVYGTAEFFTKYFPYFSVKQIRRILNSCASKGLLLKSNFNKNAYDRTIWYSLSDLALFEYNLDATCLHTKPNAILPNGKMDRHNRENGSTEKGATIPDKKTVNENSVWAEPLTPTHNSSLNPLNPLNHSAPSTPAERTAQESFEDSSLKNIFNEKFEGYKITYEELFKSCKEHYESKNSWVTKSRWKNWIKREKLDHYAKTKSEINQDEIKLKEIVFHYREYVQRIKQDRNLKLDSGNIEILTFEKWKEMRQIT